MASRKFKIITGASVAAVLGAGAFIYSLFAAQGQGVLAQAPLNVQVPVPPSFIMAVDNSGSMTFQTQFPGTDGQVCWNRTRLSFFNADGSLALSGNCGYLYVMPGSRGGTGRLGLPPLDLYGFARSSTYNPTYFDPSINYQPWINRDGQSYGNASITDTRIDPRNADTINLAADYFDTSDDSAFRMQNGMVIPAGTRFRVNNQTYELNYDYTWELGQVTAYFRYYPGVFYMPYTNNNDARPLLEGSNAYANVPRVRVNNVCGTGCHMWKYSIRSSDTAALQNFANWFSYYGNRNRAMIAGMTQSMADVNKMYVGYFRIGSHGSYDSSTDSRKRLPIYDMGEPAQKRQLYDNMIALTAGGGTPNRQAVNAAGLQFKRTDTDAPVKLSCQKNAVMLFTDGFSNGGTPSSTNADGDMGAPFRDGHSGTMADIAATYYNSPLRTDLPAGQVRVPSSCAAGSVDPKLDCNTNLHVNFYGVTLGARGELFNPDQTQDPYTTPAIYNNWPSAQDDNLSTVDDIWHATVNTRGEYINARTPADITGAMRRILSSVNAGASTSGSISMTGARIGAGSLAVTPSYEVANQSTDWFSRLAAFRLSVNPTTRVAEETAAWEASASLALQAFASRRIVTTKGTAALDFNGNNVSLADLCTKTLNNPGMSRCDAAEITQLGGDATTAVNYLRGDTSREARFSGGIFRTRTTLLGDIVNSSPVISSPLDDYGYRSLGGTYASTYATFLQNKRQNRRHMVYVGANDGMLHGFDGGLTADGTPNSTGGQEVFAYVPATALGHMGNLLFPYVANKQGDQKFAHRYYVDGQVTVADMQFTAGWGTALVGAAGAGGRSVFALNVSDPQSFGTTSRLWEISDLNTSLSQDVRNNIGFVRSKPVIVPTRTGTGGVAWKAIFGNGYNSISGKAVLFVVDMNDASIRMIEAVEGTGAPSGTNGIGSIIAVDRFMTTTTGGTSVRGRGRDGMADTVYAADQRGAIWKFDLESTATSVTRPVFTTRTSTETSSGTTLTYRQPITGGMTAVTGAGDGVMLIFGTGSFWFNGDERDATVQGLYGINDNSVGQPATTLTVANLTQYTVTSARTLNAGTPSTAANAGWTVALPAGERAVGNPTVSSGIVFIPTYVPNQAQAGCSTEGTNWLFGLYTASGLAALDQARKVSPTGDLVGTGTAAISLNTDGTSPVTDVTASVIPRLSNGSGPQDRACWMTINAPGAEPLYIPYPCGRQSWRQLQ